MIHMIKIYYLHRGDNILFYIGKTKTTLKKRIYRHKLKFGENIQIEEIDLVNLNEWKFWEEFYIELFKSWGFKLENKNKGGGGLEYHTQETKNKISNSFKSKSKEEIESINNKRRLSNLGKKRIGGGRKPYTKEQKIALGNRLYYKSEEFRGKKRKPVLKINKNTLEIIKEYNSLEEASLDCNINSSDICNCCRGNQKTSGGFVWKYKNSLENK